MRILDDKEKDLFIKNELQKDDLISKKADDLFNDFFKDGINIENQEKIVKLNQRRSQPITWQKRVLSMVASLMIIFLAANGYAATRGYNNIFFAIKKIFTEQEDITATKDEILLDRDITISFKDIEIADGLSIQINSLVVENNDAKLYLSITENGNSVYPGKYVVKDVSNKEFILASQNANRDSVEKIMGITYQEIINLKGIKENTNDISLEVLEQDGTSISLMRIDLKNKEISVLTGKSKGAVQKLSETELKGILGKYATLVVGDSENRKDELKYKKLMLITTLMYEKENYNNDIVFSKDKVLKAYQELTGEVVTNPKDILENNSFMYYDEEKEEFKYSENGTDGFTPYMVLEVKDLNYTNGIYIADVVFIAPTEGDYIDNNLEELDQYEMKIQFKLNSVYEYTRYQIVNSDSLKYTLYAKGGTSKVIDVSNILSEDISSQNITNTVLNTNMENDNTIKSIKFGQRADLIDGMYFTVEKLEFKENNKAVLYIKVIEEAKVASNKRIKSINISYNSPSLGATSIENSVTNTSNQFSLEYMLSEITDDVSTITIALNCEKGLISNIALDLNNKDLNVIYFNDLLNVDDADELENEIKSVASRYILMNYYKDVENDNSIEAKREMMLYTAMLLDEDGMYRNFGSESNLTNIGESIVYSIVKGYTGISFDSNTIFLEKVITRQDGSNGVEGSIKYISGSRYNLDVNIKSVEKFEKLGSYNYTITFTYSYNLKPSNTYKATMQLKDYAFDSSNPIAKQFVLYQLVDTNIQSEKIN